MFKYKECSKEVSFNADIRKSNADKRRFIVGGICEHLREICEHLRSRRVFWKSYKRVIIIAFLLSIVIGSSLAAQDSNDWNMTKGKHFIVFYKPGIPDRFILKTLEYAEKYYTDIAMNLGFSRKEFWLDDNRAKIYIYKDNKEYVDATGMPDWSGGRAIWNEKKIETFAWSRNFFNTLLPHELGHIVFREFAGISDNIPLWLDEGVAGYQEYVNRAKSKKIIKAAIKDETFIPLEELSKIDLSSMKDKDKISLFYAESLSVVEFLIKQFGNNRFYEFTQALKEGQSLDSAIRQAYKDADLRSLDDLNKAWIRYLRFYE